MATDTKNEKHDDVPFSAPLLVRYLTDAIAKKATGLECTICLNECSTPIFGCSEYHLLCGGCHERVDSCPTCSEDFGGEGPRRKRFAEKDAEELEEMRRELQEATGHATG